MHDKQKEWIELKGEISTEFLKAEKQGVKIPKAKIKELVMRLEKYLNE